MGNVTPSATPAIAPTVTITSYNAPAIVEICRLLDGVPLALEIAALWLRAHAPDEVARDIARDLDRLASPLRDLPARHRSLRAVFEHSWALLAPAEQRALARRHGWSAVVAAARDLMDYAERRTRASLGALSVAGLRATDWLEGDGVTGDDLAITVRLDVRDGVLQADFAGTAPAARGNVNCPLAVARSAVLFVLRTLLPDDVPMNGGVERAVRVAAPAGCLVDARRPSAVAAGNVETSQRIADTVFRALAARPPA